MHDDWGRFLSVNAGCFSPPHTPELAPPSTLRPSPKQSLSPQSRSGRPRTSNRLRRRKDSIPTRLYRRPSYGGKKNTNDYYAAIRVLSIRVSIHQKPHPSYDHRHYTVRARSVNQQLRKHTPTQTRDSTHLIPKRDYAFIIRQHSIKHVSKLIFRKSGMTKG